MLETLDYTIHINGSTLTILYFDFKAQYTVCLHILSDIYTDIF